MGTFLGHALPGSFFILFAFWRLFQICNRLRLVSMINIRRRVIKDSDKDVTFFTSASYPCCLEWCAQFPLEGITKILVTSIGMGGELWASTEYGRAGKIVWMGDIQHVTMYSLFCLSGIADVLSWKRLRFCPPGVDFLALANAFVGEWILFSHHLHGRAVLDIVLHTLLLYVVAGTVLTIILEYKFDRSLVASLATTYLLFVQGIWFFQVGFILYIPMRWTAWLLYELNESDQVTMATTIFAWHLGGSFVLIALLFVFTRYLCQFMCQPTNWEKLWDVQLMSSSSNFSSVKAYSLHRDSDMDEDNNADENTAFKSEGEDTFI